MNLAQRIIIWMGCNALLLLWLQPPTYQIHADGTRLEHNFVWLWQQPPEWCVDVPRQLMRFLLIIVVTAGMCLVFRTNPAPEAGK